MTVWQPRRGMQGRPDAGFTLIEVLVSLVLLALLLALLAGGLRYARSTWDATARLDEVAAADMVETFLRARLAEAMPLYEQRKAGMVRALFSGAGDSMSFVAPAPNGPAGTGLYRYTLEAAAGAGAGQRTLVVRLAPHLPLLSDSALERPPRAVRADAERPCRVIPLLRPRRPEVRARRGTPPGPAPTHCPAWSRSSSPATTARAAPSP